MKLKEHAAELLPFSIFSIRWVIDTLAMKGGKFKGFRNRLSRLDVQKVKVANCGFIAGNF